MTLINYHIKLSRAPRQGSRRNPLRNFGNKLRKKRSISRSRKRGNEVNDLTSDGLVVERGERVDERGDEEVSVEGEERVKK